MPSAADWACHAPIRAEIGSLLASPRLDRRGRVGRCSSLRDTFGIALEASQRRRLGAHVRWLPRKVDAVQISEARTVLLEGSRGPMALG